MLSKMEVQVALTLSRSTSAVGETFMSVLAARTVSLNIWEPADDHK